jgi:uncharacterized membrane protein required for colicin V production
MEAIMYNLMISFTPDVIADIAILVIMLGFVIFGMAKGFTNVFLKAFAKIASLVVAVALCSKLVEFLDKNFNLISSLSNVFAGVLPKIFGNDLMSYTLEQINSNPELVSASGMSALIVKMVLNIVGDSGINTTISLGEILAPTIAYYVGLALCFLILYILVRFVFFIIAKTIQKLFKIKLFGFIDKLLGGAIGFIEGIIFVSIVTFVISVIPLPFAVTATSAISMSKVGVFVNSINVIELLLSAFNSFDYVRNFILSKFPV